MKSIKMERAHLIPGKGIVLVVNLFKNKLVNELWVDELPIKVGETIKVINNGLTYKITGIEMSRNLTNGKINHSVGLVVKEIKEWKQLEYLKMELQFI